MTFQDRIKNYVEKRQKDLPRLSDWIAESQSRHSATSNQSWLPQFRGAREAEIVLFLSLYIPDWESWEVIARIRDQAYHQRYEGRWNQVQLLLEQESSLPSFEEWWNEIESPDSFFGNFLRNCEKFLKRERFVYRDIERDRRRPKRKIRRRGYLDKGSLLPAHKRGRNLPDPNGAGRDDREKVKYKHLPSI